MFVRRYLERDLAADFADGSIEVAHARLACIGVDDLANRLVLSEQLIPA